jgi:hypothetical protein
MPLAKIHVLEGQNPTAKTSANIGNKSQTGVARPYLGARSEVDPTRMGLWDTSYAGGHALVTQWPSTRQVRPRGAGARRLVS